MTKIITDEFNSSIFRMKMGNIFYTDLTTLKEILKIAEKEYDHLSVKVDCKDLQVCNYLLKEGFYIVDTLVSYAFDYEKNNLLDYKYSEDVIINKVEQKDVKEICKIAYNSFYNDRFHNDPALDDELCNNYYENWINNSCNGFADIVLVAKDKEGHLLGFGTGKNNNEEESVLVLNAVTSYARGKGVYTAMIYEAMKYFKGKSKTLTLGTQINNYAVQKAWAKLGFKIFDSKYVLHKRICK